MAAFRVKPKKIYNLHFKVDLQEHILKRLRQFSVFFISLKSHRRVIYTSGLKIGLVPLYL